MDHKDSKRHSSDELEALRRELVECKRQLADSRWERGFDFFADTMQNDLLAVINSACVHLKVNSAYSDFWGRDSSVIVGLPVQELLGGEVFERIKEKIDRCLADEAVCFEDWFKSAAGRRRFMSVVLKPYHNSEGKVAGLICIARDLTDGKQATDFYKESKERVNILFDKSADAMFVADMDGVLLQVNDQAARSTGYSKSELLGLNVLDVDADLKGDVYAFQDLLTKVSDSGIVTFCSRLRRKDGWSFPVELTITKLSLLGEPVILGIARDNSEIEAKELEYGHMLRTAIEGCWVTDQAGLILQANRAADEMHGYGYNQLRYQTLEKVVGARAFAEWRKHLDRVVEHGKEVLETRHLRKGGGWLDVEANTSLLASGKSYKFVSFLRNVTERKRMEREREIALNLIKRISNPSGLEELLADITKLMRDWSGCEAVGIRLRQGDDYPYFGTRGFPAEFVKLENSLCETDSDGKVLRDSDGKAVLACMCGNILRGNFDSSLPCFTENGSFWTNSTSDLLASAMDEDWLARARKRCNLEGYESMALVPLRYGDDTLGLLQFNHTGRERFDRATIDLFERLAANLAIGLAQRRSTDQLSIDRAKYRSLYNSMAEMFVLHRVVYREGKAVDYEILDCNRAFCKITGIDRENAIGKLASKLYGGGEAPFLDIYARTSETGIPIYFETYFEPMSKYFKVSAFSAGKGEFATVSLDITAQKQKEEELRKSDERLELVLDSVRDAVWDWRVDTGETYFSSRWFTMLGYKANELPSTLETWRTLLHPDDLPEAEQTIGRHLETGDPFEIEFRMRAKGGGWKWVLGRGCMIERDVQGNAVRMLGTHGDITERKRSEAALRKSEAKMRSIFRASPIGIGVVVNRVFADVNNRFCEMVGFDRDELIGKSSRAIYPTQEDFDMVGRVQYQQISSKGTGMVETRMMRKDGGIIDVILSTTPLDPDDPSEGLTFTAMDITNRKRAEEELRLSHEIMLSVLDGIDATVYVADLETHEILFMNKRMLEEYGQDCTGQICHQVFRNKSAPCEYCMNDLLVDSTDKPTGVHTWEYLNPVTGRWYMNHARAVQWQGGKKVRLQIAIDISELKKSQHEKEQLESQLALAQKMDALGTLAGGIAHDFNNILATVMGYSELIEDDLETGDPLREDLQQIVKAAVRGKDLVRRILTFSRKAAVNRKTVSLNRAISEAAAMLSRVIPKMICLELDLDKDIDPVKANPQQLEHIIFNLVSNAADAIEGEGMVTISTRNTAVENGQCEACGIRFSGDYVILSIKDDGAGMSPEVKAHMLDPFFTTKEIGKGTGLGLSTVYGIVKNHRGHLACKTRPGEGTEFIIYLPKADDLAIEAGHEADANEDETRGEETLLLVDDDSAIREIAGKMLTGSGYKVLKAKSGEEALQILEREKEGIEGVILDLGMPGMGGKKCLPKIIELNPKTKVLVASGYIQYETGGKLEKLGAMGMVAKPYRKMELLKQVRRMLDA